MKSLFIVLSSVFFLISKDTMTELRDDFHIAKTETQVNNFIKKYKNDSKKESIPYLAAMVMQKADFTMWPHKKYAYFREGKSKLESYIDVNPNCIEGRYVRVLLQSRLPSILNYNDNIKLDKKYIIENVAKTELPINYQKKILNNIKKIK